VHAVTIPKPKPALISLPGGSTVSGLLQAAEHPRAGLVLAHGAGAGMEHPFMAAVSRGLGSRGVACLRFQFPYMERGSRRPDAPESAQAAVRAAVAEAARLLPALCLFAGGKSYGGRMTSQAQAQEPLPGVRGLVFLGFPLHPPGKPSIERAAHLSSVRVAMYFLQGTRDDFAAPDLLQPLVKGLADRATLYLFPDADHSFHVPARSGRKDGDVLVELLDRTAEWIMRHAD
jgi:predicted alpha/beta-hydrolase family hydrolase